MLLKQPDKDLVRSFQRDRECGLNSLFDEEKLGLKVIVVPNERALALVMRHGKL
jgi:hypothetical protein